MQSQQLRKSNLIAEFSSTAVTITATAITVAKITVAAVTAATIAVATITAPVVAAASTPAAAMSAALMASAAIVGAPLHLQLLRSHCSYPKIVCYGPSRSQTFHGVYKEMGTRCNVVFDRDRKITTNQAPPDGCMIVITGPAVHKKTGRPRHIYSFPANSSQHPNGQNFPKTWTNDQQFKGNRTIRIQTLDH